MLELNRSLYGSLIDTVFLIFGLVFFSLIPLRFMTGIIITIIKGEFTFFEFILSIVTVYTIAFIVIAIVLYSNVFTFGLRIEGDKLFIKKFMKTETVSITDIKRIVYDKYVISYKSAYRISYGKKTIILSLERFNYIEKFIKELSEKYDIKVETSVNSWSKWM